MKKYILSTFLAALFWACTKSDQSPPGVPHHPMHDDEVSSEHIDNFAPSRASVTEPDFWDPNYRSYRIVNMDAEVSYSLFVRFGSDTNTVKTAIRKYYTNSSAIIERLTGLRIVLNRIKIWTMPDPYESATSAQSILYAWSQTAASRYPSFQQFLNNKTLGGSGYVNGGNVTTARYSVVTLGGWPSASGTTAYSFGEYCIMHELLHNLGLRHSQNDCAWLSKSGQRLGRLDYCGACENSQACVPSSTCTQSTYGMDGGIMSYCHVYGRMQWMLEPAILAVLHRAVYYASPALPTYTPTSPPPQMDSTFSISGTPHSSNTRADTGRAVDGSEVTRFLTNGPTTLTYTFSQPVTRSTVYLSSGYMGGSFNQSLTLLVDGVSVPLAYTPVGKFTRSINVTGKKFTLTTTGSGNISRIYEIRLK